MSEVYDRYVDTAGNYHYTDTETGHQVIPNTAVGNFPPPRLIKTNADSIRCMTDERLAEWLNDMQGYAFSCGLIEARIREYPNRYNKWLEWLKEEVRDEA